MRRFLITAVASIVLAGSATGDTYWIEYNAASGVFPEEDGSGWIRHKFDGGDERSFDNGCLVMDGMTIPGVCDWYEMPMNGALDPEGPGEMFVCQWRIRVDSLFGYYDPCVGIASDDSWLAGFSLSQDAIFSAFESGVSAPFEPNVPHTFELRSYDMRTYVLSIDAIEVIEGNLWESLSTSFVNWGDGTYPDGSLARWAFFRFGVVHAPVTGDVNCDGTVDFRDINPFVQALTDADAYQNTYPDCWPENADINADGSVDFADINPFIGLLIP